MARLGATITSNARFRPFSYQEMLAPLAAYTQEYNAVQEGLSNLGDAANAYSEYLAGTHAGKVVDEYNQKLNDAIADMSKNGLGVTNRDTLYGLKRQYNNDILKINKAAQSLDTLYKTMQQGQLKDTSLMVGKMPTIDDLLANPSATPTVASGNDMYAHAAKSAQAASARNFLNTTEVGQNVMKYYIDNVVKNGYTPEDLARFQQMTESIPELKGAIDDIKAMYNTQNLSAGDQIRSDAFIMRGIMDGAGYQEQHKYMDNPEEKAELDWNYYQKKAELNDEYAGKQAVREAFLAGKVDANGNPITSDGGGDTEGLSTVSYFNGEANKKAYDSLRSLSSPTGGLSAAVFGKTFGSINPMKVYDLAESAYKSAYSSYKNAHKLQAKGYGVDWQEPDRNAELEVEGQARAAGNKAKAELLKQYGLSRTLTDDEYNALKSVGYSSSMTPKQMFQGNRYGSQWLSQLGTKVDSSVKENSVYEVNGDEVNERVFNAIRSHAKVILTNNDDSPVIHKLNKRGEESKTIRNWDTIGDYDKSRIGYSWANNKFILTNNGVRYAIDPSLISIETDEILRQRDRIYKERLARYETQVGRKATQSEQTEIKSQLAQEIISNVARMASNDIIQAKSQTSKDAE